MKDTMINMVDTPSPPTWGDLVNLKIIAKRREEHFSMITDELMGNYFCNWGEREAFNDKQYYFKVKRVTISSSFI